MIKAILFDCFGVLAEDGWTPFKRKYIAHDPELALEVADLGKQTDLGIIGYEQMIEQISELVQVKPDLLRGAVERKIPNQELFSFIMAELKPRYKIGLLSNANYDVLNQLFTPEQASVFDTSVISFEAQLTKPDSRMFELAASRMGVQPEECLFIDDVERYCQAAEDIGMQTIWYQSCEQIIADLQLLIHN